jgi:hypothetical protein
VAATATNDELTGNFGSWLQDASVAYRGNPFRQHRDRHDDRRIGRILAGGDRVGERQCAGVGTTAIRAAGNAAVLIGAVTNPAGPTAPPSTQAFASVSDSSPTIYTLSSTDSATIMPHYTSGASNEFDFTGNVTDENLWFLQSGNDLRIYIMGTNNQATIAGWFNNGNQASEVFTSGGLRLDSQISQLVQAMGAYSGSNAGFDRWPATVHQIPNDPALQNTVAAAWHA